MTIMLHTTPTDPAALARRPDPAGPLAVATPTTRRLADASLSRNTRRAYAGALRRLDAWRGPAPLTDALLAAYLGAIFEAGRAPATAPTPKDLDNGCNLAAPSAAAAGSPDWPCTRRTNATSAMSPTNRHTASARHPDLLQTGEKGDRR